MGVGEFIDGELIDGRWGTRLVEKHAHLVVLKLQHGASHNQSDERLPTKFVHTSMN